MPRYFYVSLLIAGIAGVVIGSVFFFYKTGSPMIVGEFGGVSLRIEYATTKAAREKGLGGRESVLGDYGMLFVFPKDDLYGFWMKDTLVSLDIFWLDAEGKVVSIARDVATTTYPRVFYPTMPARYVLETAAGFAREHSVATGTPLLLKNFPTVSE